MPFALRPSPHIHEQCAVIYHAGPFLKLPLAYVSDFWLLITLLVLNSGPVYAEWAPLYNDDRDGSTTYVDPDTIRRKGDMVKMWALHNFKTIQIVWDTSFLSRESQREYDCVEERSRRIAFTYFSGKMGSGTVVYSDADEQKWEPVQPGSVGEALRKIACNKK